jgi:hypothetical protein
VVTVNGGVVILLVSLVSDIVEVLPILSSRFVVTLSGSVLMLSVSPIIFICDRKITDKYSTAI